TDKNLNAIGAKIYIYTISGLQMDQHHVVRGYQSTSENVVHFGLGKDDTVYKAVVVWPDEKSEELANLGVNQVVTLNYKNAKNQKFDVHPKYNPLLADVTQKIGVDYKHM